MDSPFDTSTDNVERRLVCVRINVPVGEQSQKAAQERRRRPIISDNRTCTKISGEVSEKPVKLPPGEMTMCGPRRVHQPDIAI